MDSALSFDEWLRRFKDITGLEKDADVAEALGMDPKAFSGRKKRGSIPTKETIEFAIHKGLSLDRLFHGSTVHVLAGLASDAYTPLPLVKPRLAAGGGSVVIDESVETWLHFRTEWLKQIGPARQLVLMRVEGDSMEPTLYENDVIMIHQGKRELRPGKLYAIGIDDRLLVKRLHPALGGGIEVISDNPRYGKEVIKEGAPGFRVIGQAVWMARKLE